ncbi:Vesicle-fusing ATPase [Dendrobium catenatum]|uniref:Vesicle-fusing ATPase n=1 Tax=Dendrobium catenatum TaxID=906689 RepID=A0A2I0VUH9_9ASPA|nr:Vesicle-fusing ATPase [Dendrobium catenatum]
MSFTQNISVPILPVLATSSSSFPALAYEEKSGARVWPQFVHNDRCKHAEPGARLLQLRLPLCRDFPKFAIRGSNSAQVIVGDSVVLLLQLWNEQLYCLGALNAFEKIDLCYYIFPTSSIFAAIMGIKHVKGMLLYGSPGTGKTLMAWQIEKLLNGREPKIDEVEALNNVILIGITSRRDLLDEARQHQTQQTLSQLSIIILDDIESSRLFSTPYICATLTEQKVISHTRSDVVCFHLHWFAHSHDPMFACSYALARSLCALSAF